MSPYRVSKAQSSSGASGLVVLIAALLADYLLGRHYFGSSQGLFTFLILNGVVLAFIACEWWLLNKYLDDSGGALLAVVLGNMIPFLVILLLVDIFPSWSQSTWYSVTATPQDSIFFAALVLGPIYFFKRFIYAGLFHDCDQSALYQAIENANSYALLIVVSAAILTLIIASLPH